VGEAGFNLTDEALPPPRSVEYSVSGHPQVCPTAAPSSDATTIPNVGDAVYVSNRFMNDSTLSNGSPLRIASQAVVPAGGVETWDTSSTAVAVYFVILPGVV
jgi:hypothetical protein